MLFFFHKVSLSTYKQQVLPLSICIAMLCTTIILFRPHCRGEFGGSDRSMCSLVLRLARYLMGKAISPFDRCKKNTS